MSIFVLLMTVARLLTALLVGSLRRRRLMCLMSATAARRAALTTSSPSSTAYSVIRIVSTQKRARNLPPNPTSPLPLSFGDRVSSPNDALKGRRLIKGPGDILLTFVKFLPNKISTSRAHKTAAAAQELKRCVFRSSPSPSYFPLLLLCRRHFQGPTLPFVRPEQGAKGSEGEGSAAAAGKSQTLTKRRKTCDTKCGEA